MIKKGIVLAGGNGSRLYPLTIGVTKQLLPIYNKPLIYYPLSVLFLAGIREILLIAQSSDIPRFQKLLGDGSQFGVTFSYQEQQTPKGVADAFLLGEDFIQSEPVCLILGDNIFYGHHLTQLLQNGQRDLSGATLFGYTVKDPSRYGVVAFDEDGSILEIQEKPINPLSHVAITGLYFYDTTVVERAKKLSPSARGELEITDLNRLYLHQKKVQFHLMGRGCTWLDAGTYDSLMQASQFVQVIEERQGNLIASLEEIAFNQGWISREQLWTLGKAMGDNPYGRALLELAQKR